VLYIPLGAFDGVRTPRDGIADFVPVLSDFTTPAAIIWDAGVAAYKVYQCPK
jgi:hypothetical protein